MMSIEEVFTDALLMLLCYVYILFMIFVSSKIDRLPNASHVISRKFLHAMIGNLVFIIPFFTSHFYPFLVALPFVFVTFFASPYSPFDSVGRRLRGLADLTEKGHHLGLVFYAVSYTTLALFFASKPYIIAAGILPMAYGDSLASVVGQRYGKRRYKLVEEKTLEGSAAMFLGSFISLTISLAFFSTSCSFPVLEKIFPALAAAVAATLVESFSPVGFDNLTVPASSVLTFLFLGGGI